MRKIWVAILFTGVMGATAIDSVAGEIARWNSMGAVPLAGTYEPVSTDESTVVSNLVAGVNLRRDGSSPAGNTFAAAGYSGTDSNAAMTAGHYWETVISPDDGFGIAFEKITYRMRRSGSGPPLSQWAYSLNGSTFTWLLPVHPVLDSYTNDRDVDLSAVSALQNVSGPVWFRMYAWGGGAANNSWGVYGREDVLVFSGTVISMTGPPVIGFSPGSDVQVHVSNTLEVAVSLFPPGSGIQQWDVVPVPDGSYGLSGGSFTYTPAGSDEGKTITLSVVATNSYGTTTGMLDIAVMEYLPPGTYMITFENTGEEKTSYNLGAVTLSGEVWMMDQARIGDTTSDVKIGARSARLGRLATGSMTSSNKLQSAGLGTISFLYAQYGGDTNGAEVVLEVATDYDPDTWVEVGRVDANGVTELTKYEVPINLNHAMYLRIRNEYVEGIGQVNVDNIIITPYEPPVYSGYEAFLLSYNVTPGDPGTAPGDDLDGDGFTNQQEYDAVPKTNPYDADVHP